MLKGNNITNCFNCGYKLLYTDILIYDDFCQLYTKCLYCGHISIVLISYKELRDM